MAFCRDNQKSWLRRVSTTVLHRLYDFPVITNHAAIDLFRRWLAEPRMEMIETEPSGTRVRCLELADRGDAYLAAFAICGNLRPVSFDRDFRQIESGGLDLQLQQS